MHDADRAPDEQADDNQPFDATTDPHPAGVDGNLDVVPGPGGYAGRDPKTEMPRVPSVPETQPDPQPHGGEPDQKERDLHE